MDYMEAKVIWSVLHETSFCCSVRLQLFARGPASLSAPTSVFKQPAAWAWGAGPPLVKHTSLLGVRQFPQHAHLERFLF